MKKQILLFQLVCCICLSGPVYAGSDKPIYKDKSAPIERRVDDLMGRMTLREKVLQLQNRGAGKLSEIDKIFGGESYGCTHEMGMSAYDCAVMYKALQEYMLTKTRLGIPILTSAEGIEGIVQNECTIFPHALAQGSTFNPGLIQQMTEAAGEEAKAIGIHQILSPVLDIARELRWGRVEETFGEDPFLIAEMGIAFVRGYQKYAITCMPKHFVAHGTPSGGLNCASVSGGERDLRSLYLYPFRRVISETNPLAVMSCYSAYDGVPMTGSSYYMTDILRGELGFKGYVYSDWGSVERLLTFHHAVKTRDEAARQALEAGIDLNVDSSFETLEKMVNDGQLDVKYIDIAVRRMLTVKFALGLFDAPYADPSEVKKVVRNARKVALAKEIADESVVLLENKNNLLPLDLNKYKSIAVIGPNSNQTVMGDYSWTGPDTHEGVTLLQGLKEVVGDKVVINHAVGCDWWSQDKSRIPEAVQAAMKSDLVVVAIGTRSTYLGRAPKYSTSGEGFDLSSLELPGVQLDLLKELKKAGKPIVVVFIAGKPLALPWVKEHADALLVQWYGGEQQGSALADILVGKVNPSGKLNVSFPRSTGNTPCFYNHFVTDREEPFDQPGSPEEPKGHYIFDMPEPLWNFGQGKSYTSFEYKECQLSDSLFSSQNDTLTVTVEVANTGRRDGKEVVQLYIHDKVSSVSTPIQQLKAFQKVMIKAGETKCVRLQLPIKELALYNARMQEVVEPGEFEIQIGSASNEIRLVKTISFTPFSCSYTPMATFPLFL